MVYGKKYHNINGKCFRVIHSIYRNIKSCVLVNGNKTDFFISNVGVRQGENLSPLLFNLFLNDLEDFLSIIMLAVSNATNIN